VTNLTTVADDDKTENDDGNIEIDQSVDESNVSNSINSAKDIDDNITLKKVKLKFKVGKQIIS
jgi:hypothetical protein